LRKAEVTAHTITGSPVGHKCCHTALLAFTQNGDPGHICDGTASLSILTYFTYMHALAGNATVLVSMWHGRGMQSTKCPLVSNNTSWY